MAQPKLLDPLKEDLKSSARRAGDPRPADHWSRRVYGDPIKDDFRVFLALLWSYLGLPAPTDLQLDIAYQLQHHGWTEEIDHLILMAFRGAAKSWITAAYVLWNLYRDPQLKIGVVSGSMSKATQFVTFCFGIISGWDLLKHLRPRPDQRQSSRAFDVGPARQAQSPSLWTAGITSQIVGNRADIIIGDDVETNTNSATVDMREKLSDNTREFDAIIHPGGQIIFLGTPQTESSIYNVLEARGYRVMVYPARYPNGKQMRAYGTRLAAYILHKMEMNPSLIGESTEPGRFSNEDLLVREMQWGKAGFALQFMLDTSLADVNKYPLKLMDVIVMQLDRKAGPDLVTYGRGDHLRWKDVNVITLNGDAVFMPGSVSETSSKWDDVVGYIDPSGKGEDEATLTIGAVLNGTPFVLKQGGWLQGYTEKTLDEMANLIVNYGCRRILIEENFGQGMMVELLRPRVKLAVAKFNKGKPEGAKAKMPEILSERAARQQKELRMLEVLEPVFGSHRLVINRDVLVEDWEQTVKRDGTDLRDRYSLMYQITRLTREKDCLTHDDRVEGLAGMLSMVMDQLGLVPQEEAEKTAQRRLEEEWEKFFEEADKLQGVGKRKTGRRGNLRAGRRT